MKKVVSVLFIAFFVINYLYAQTTGTLTNSIIIKMVKAKLSDDLIIDEINSSKVNFKVSADSIKFLSDKNVSGRVIEAMKTANGTQTSTTATSSDTSSPRAIVQVKQPESETLPVKELPKEKIVTEKSNKSLNEKSTISVTAVSYVIPLQELMIFFDTEFQTLEGHIKAWDLQIKSSIEKGNKIKDNIREVEKELTYKKNADSKGFSNEIIILKKKLSEYRENYKQYENNMVTDGLRIVKEIEDIGTELDKSINKKFSDISQVVRKSDPDPSVIEIPKSITISKQEINDNIVNYVAL